MSNAELVAFIKKNPVSVGCGALALALAAAIYFRGGEIPEAEAALAQKSADAERHAANVNNSVQLKEQVDSLVEANKAIDSRIVRAGQLGINNQYFYKLESETGVKMLDFRQLPLAPPGKGPKTTYNPIGFSVQVSGTLPQLIDYLHRLEGGTHYCRVMSANVGITPAGGRTGPMSLSLNLELLGLP